MIQISGRNLVDLWFNFLVSTATSQHSIYYYPSMYTRRIFGETKGIHFDDSVMEKDFYRFSGYNESFKLARLREAYFSDKVQKQYELLCSIIRNLQPRQARGFIKFTEPAFNKTDKLKCLDSLYVQKITMTTYEAMIVFRNTEIWPKTFMDFVFLNELLEGFNKYRVRCKLFCALMTSAFINMHQTPTAALMLRKYGVYKYNEPFTLSLKKWKDNFGDPACIDTIKMQWILRAVVRTHKLLAEEGVDMDTLIEGK